ncbi:phosphate acyltransferase [Chloropicon primus]|uniref:1-acyl-sn-glycerol-3-phosphate acyltransferase n=1 Tax=Chloropicon primus TaxID=1764295 RepID=A0A5B8MG62_9CHLO|nr:phosphate acyltransferase [Chloropicon primus]UPQ98608.1 phosphate acyltransferase [Chloropicon primus]|eukprot:QDZ19399.1 phosphate acyltransferase [Chloropicon primus]
MILAYPFVYLFDRKRRRFLHAVNRVWASLSIMPFFRVNVSGRDNLPPSTTGAVYVANHQSVMDIFVLFLLGMPFKFVSKIEVFYVPIIGLAMYLTGHVALKRMDGRSQAQTFKQCCGLLKEGVSILVFPEGTRSRDGKVKDFKAGAFKMARRGGAPVVPISLRGTNKVMPHGKGFLRFYPGVVDIKIHEPLALEADGDVQDWSDRTKESILSGLDDQ